MCFVLSQNQFFAPLLSQAHFRDWILPIFYCLLPSPPEPGSGHNPMLLHQWSGIRCVVILLPIFDYPTVPIKRYRVRRMECQTKGCNMDCMLWPLSLTQLIKMPRLIYFCHTFLYCFLPCHLRLPSPTLFSIRAYFLIRFACTRPSPLLADPFHLYLADLDFPYFDHYYIKQHPYKKVLKI